MTREEIEALEPGRLLDSIVAERIMGWMELSPIDPSKDWGVGVNGYRRNYGLNPNTDRQEPLPHYSTDIAAAWKVFENFGFQGRVGFQGMDYFASVMVGFEDNGNPRYGDANERSSAAEAICIAALIGVFVGEPIG